MPIQRAKKTFDAIEAAMYERPDEWKKLAEDWIERLRYDRAGDAREELPERRMAVSALAHECSRYMYYRVIKAPKEPVIPRMRRLFHRGHLEEPRVLAMLQLIGVLVAPQQFVQRGAIVGFLDGYIKDGLPDEPCGDMVLEIKTHSDKNFKKLKRSGVRAHFPKHSGQMDAGMALRGAGAALYVGVNKNDDHIHMEIVKKDSFRADLLLQRGDRVLAMDRPPPRIEGEIDRYPCRFCDFRSYCWLSDGD